LRPGATSYDTSSMTVRMMSMPRPFSTSAGGCLRGSAGSPGPRSSTATCSSQRSSWILAVTSYRVAGSPCRTALVQASEVAIRMSEAHSSATPSARSRLRTMRRTMGMPMASRGMTSENSMFKRTPPETSLHLGFPGGSVLIAEHPRPGKDPARIRPAHGITPVTGDRSISREMPGQVGPGSVFDADREVLDHGVGEQGLRHLPDLREGGLVRRAVELELEPLALPYVGDAGEAEPGQRPGDRLALRVQDLGLQHDVHDDARHCGPPVAVSGVAARVSGRPGQPCRPGGTSSPRDSASHSSSRC